MDKLLIIIFLFIYFISDVKSQLHTIDSLTIQINNTNQDTLKARLYFELGKAYHNENPDSSLIYYFKAETLLKKNDLIFSGKIILAKIYLSISWIYDDFKGKYDQALIYTEKALVIFSQLTKTNDKKIIIEGQKGISACYNNFGNIHKNLGNYDKAIYYLEKAQKVDIGINDRKGLAVTYTSLGIVYRNQGDYEKALSFYLQSLKIYEELKELKSILICYNNIGGIHYYQGNYEKAIVYFEKAISICKKSNVMKELSGLYNNMALIYTENDSLEKAIEFFQLSMDIREKMNDEKGISQCYSNLGIVCIKKKDFDKANEYLKKAFSLFQKQGDISGMALIYKNFSDLNIELADNISEKSLKKTSYYNNAIQYGINSFQLARDHKMNNIMRGSSSNLMHAYYGIGNINKAYQYATIFIDINNILFREENVQAITEMDAKYQAEKKENKIKLLEGEKKIQSLEISSLKDKRNKQLIIFILLLLLVIIIILSLYYRFKAHQKLKTEKQIAGIRKQHFQEVIESQELERKRISGDLHDSVGQILTAARLNLFALGSEINTNTNENREAYNNSLILLDEATTEIRNISHLIMPGALIKLGIIPAIKDMVEKLRSSHIVKINLLIDDIKIKLRDTDEINLFRLIQELLNNTVKHSKANEINIFINKINNRISVELTDNGIGFDTNEIKTSKGIGWKNIYSRVEMLNGEISIFSEKEKGTRISFSFCSQDTE